MVPWEGLEPSIPCENTILSRARIPFRHHGWPGNPSVSYGMGKALTTAYLKLHQILQMELLPLPFDQFG